MIVTLAVTMIAAGLLISERLRPDLVALLVLVTLGLTGITSPAETLAGFGSSVVITLIAISIISAALQQTGVTARFARGLHGLGKGSETRLILVVTLASAGLSLFMNNIAAVGVLLPATLAVARRSRISASRLLIPMAYGAGLGGMATLLTTGNLIVSAALKDAGKTGFGLLDFFPIGAPIVIVGALYLITLGKRLLPNQLINQARQPEMLSAQLESTYHLQESLARYLIKEHSPLTCNHAMTLLHDSELDVLAVLRGEQTLLSSAINDCLRPGDVVVTPGRLEPEQESVLGIERIEKNEPRIRLTDENTTLAEVILSPHSALIGRSLRQEQFREKMNLNVVAVWRESLPVLTDLADLPLRVGDALLVQGSAAAVRDLHAQRDLVLIAEDPDAVLKPHKHNLALIITLLTLGLAALDLLPLAVVVLAGALLLVLTGCLEPADIYRAIEWKIIFLIAGMWPLSNAIRSTGLASSAIEGLLQLVGPVSPIIIAAVLILVALLLTQFMSSQVTALVLAPLALAAAAGLGADARSLGMAVALGCSLSFPTPYGHPVNLMVMSPGGYTFRDFVRVGLPLTLLVIITILIGLHFFWGM